MEEKPIPLTKPFMNDDIRRRVLAVLDSGFLTEGPVTHDLEDLCQAYVGAKHCIAVSSCTAGLEMALRCLGIGPGDEVIVPDYTYPATADVVAIVGARVVLVDIDPATLLIDYDALETAVTQRTRAIVPVSLFGNPLDYGRLNAIKRKYGIPIVEDAACAMGSEWAGHKVGTLADITVFSFHPRKFITTGEGGLITTENREWAAWLRSYKKFGIGIGDPGGFLKFERIGTNYKLSDVLSAIGVGQMQLVRELLARRRAIAARYVALLEHVDGIRIPSTTAAGRHSYQSFCIMVEDRDRLRDAMRRSGIEVQIGTYTLHREPAFRSSAHCRVHGGLKGSEDAGAHCLALPLYHDLCDEDQQRVVNELMTALRR
jgi:dTDP-4-amino-4,6-dideoxygalactose transaminase